MTRFRPWTPEQEAKLAALRAQQLSVPAIAAALGLTAKQVESHICYLRRGLRQARPWNDMDLAVLGRLLGQRLGWTAIAAALDRSIDSVKARARADGHDLAAEKNHSRPGRDRIEPGKMRNCLRHGGPFFSSWAGERVCPACKTSFEWKNPPTSQMIAGGTGFRVTGRSRA